MKRLKSYSLSSVPSTIGPAKPAGVSHESAFAPSSLARPATAEAATLAFSPSSSSRLPSPAMSTRRRPSSSWATATHLSLGFASPDSTSACRGWSSESPSKNGTTRASAAVSSGAPWRVVTSIGTAAESR